MTEESHGKVIGITLALLILILAALKSKAPFTTLLALLCGHFYWKRHILTHEGGDNACTATKDFP